MNEHTVTINHAPDHDDDGDDHDGCDVDLHCRILTDNCRTWWPCAICDAARDVMGLDDLAEVFDDNLRDTGEAHGVTHREIDGRWMTPGDQCLGYELDHDAYELVYTLGDGEHPVELEYDDGYLYITAICAACACEKEHDGDFGTSGHAGPCPSHTCIKPTSKVLRPGTMSSDITATSGFTFPATPEWFTSKMLAGEWAAMSYTGATHPPQPDAREADGGEGR